MRDERTGEISYGYAATYAIHTDKAGNNPHAHILVANRHIDPKTGKWAAKRRTEYALDQNGERIPVIDPATGEQKTGAKNRKVWKRVDVSNNPLDSTEFLERLRADWAKQCNLMLPEGVRIDHRSLEAQGIERIPTIHEGHASREITKRGGHSILNAINRRIATANRYLTAIRKQMGDPTGLLGQFKEQARKELDTAMSRFRESLVFDRQPIASRGRQLVEAPTPPPGARPAGAWNPSLIPCRGRSDANRGVPSRNRWTNWTRPGVSSPTSPNGGRPSLHGKSGTCNGSSTWRARPAKRPGTRTRSRADGSDTRPRGPPPSNPSF